MATVAKSKEPPQSYHDREREIELEAALERFWNFCRTCVPLDSLEDKDQDECWALDKLGRRLLKGI
ncbi:MAG TPA: hypothetical protein VK832_03545 [Burkholderiaceae bacterium]|jgi:hypothetical protein|nr:hypothetical protein [Burkholderiaceae bacterium]